MSDPTTMTAWAVPAPGAGLQRIDKPRPQPAQDEVRVRVTASSINPIDLLVAGGAYTHGDLAFPVVPGWDFAGTVESAGSDVTRLAVGDEVFGYWSKPVFGDGTWAEFVTIRQDAVITARPASLSVHQAAAVPLAALTALLAVDAVSPQSGEPLLVVGASGAVGAYTLQLAAQRGAKVIATAKPGEEARLRGLGAADTIDYTATDVAAAVRERWPEGVPTVIDIVNDPVEAARLATLVYDGGRVASARFAFDRRALAARDVTAANVSATRCDAADLERLTAELASGRLAVMLSEVRPFAGLATAVEDATAGGRGKIVIDGPGAAT